MKAKQIPAATREALAARSGGRCEVRGDGGHLDAVHAHHRRPRGMGGSRDATTNRLSNLLHVCLPCHEWIESNREQARGKGWLVASWNDPSDVPVMIHGPRPVFLEDDGSYRTPDPGELIDTTRLAYPGGEA